MNYRKFKGRPFFIGFAVVVALACTGAAGRMTSPIGLWRLLVRAGIVSHPYLRYAVPDKRDAIAALTSRTTYWDMI